MSSRIVLIGPADALPGLQERLDPSAEIQTFTESEATEEYSVPAPFAKFEDMALFLTQREEDYFAASAPKTGIGLTPVHHEVLQPRMGVLKTARASLFTDLKLLTSDDLLRPVAVLLQPSLTLTTYPPRLARFGE